MALPMPPAVGMAAHRKGTPAPLHALLRPKPLLLGELDPCRDVVKLHLYASAMHHSAPLRCQGLVGPKALPPFSTQAQPDRSLRSPVGPETIGAWTSSRAPRGTPWERPRASAGFVADNETTRTPPGCQQAGGDHREAHLPEHMAELRPHGGCISSFNYRMTYLVRWVVTTLLPNLAELMPKSWKRSRATTK